MAFFKESIMATNPLEFIQQTRTEAGKVVWPTRGETIATTIFVIILVLLAGLFLFAVDQTLSFIIKWILSFGT